MTSVNTNAAALTALRTLQNTNSALEATQSRISTGFKIGEAKDNAAYWAISTTLKSDNKSLSTVKDALGLGASTVDTAYQGLTKAKDVLDEIKSKLTAATQDGVDRDTIQQEISQLQDQLKSIASSSVFSGENWLSVDSSASSYNANKAVVSSFSRDASGAVSIGTISVDTSNAALYDNSTAVDAAGILDKALTLKTSGGRDLQIGGKLSTVGNSNDGGLTNTAAGGVVGGKVTATVDAEGGTPTAGTNVKSGTVTGNAADVALGTIDLAKLANGDKLTFNITSKDGANAAATREFTFTFKASGTLGSGEFTTEGELVNLINGAGGVNNTATADITSHAFKITTTGNAASSVTMNSLVVKDSTGVIRDRGFLVNANSTATDFNIGTAEKLTTDALTLTGLTSTDKINFTFSINGGADLNVSVARGSSLDDIVANLNGSNVFNGKAVASKNGAGTALVFTASGAYGSTATDVTLKEVSFSDADGKNKTVTNTAFNNIADFATFQVGGAFAGPITLDTDDSIAFDIQVNDAKSATTIRIDRDLVNSALTTSSSVHTSGIISTADDYKKVLQAALTKASVTNVDVSVTSNHIVFTGNDKVGANAKIIVTDKATSTGGATMSVDKLDISKAGLAAVNAKTSDDIKAVLTAYISVVNSAINKVTSAAASLGSVASRIDMQKSFVNTLMDTIDKGVGNLVDADMSEESTKLQALQVKQQLGVQALSIANQSAQSVLSLFSSGR